MSALHLPRQKRGCGMRQTGGTYLFCDMQFVHPCPSLPIELPERCPICGEELEQFRGIKVVNPQKYFVVPQKTLVKCIGGTCPACYPPEKGALMWVGKQYYTAQSFMTEALKMGISKRIAKKPKGLEIGDVIYLIHPEAFAPKEGNVRGTAGIFVAAHISAFHRIITEKQESNEKLMSDLEAQGITPVIEYDPPVGTPSQVEEL